MELFRRCFRAPEQKKSIVFSARSSVIITPVSGRVTEVDDPNKDIWSDQFSSGDQNDFNRIPFWNSGFSTCPNCGERNMSRYEEKAGIRYNGELYGTEIFRCKTKDCNWFTSFKFDDKNPDNWHFETKDWPRGITHFPHSYMLMWADKHKLPPTIKHQIFLQKLDGDKLLCLYRNNRLEGALDTNSKVVKNIQRAIQDRYGSILLH